MKAHLLKEYIYAFYNYLHQEDSVLEYSIFPEVKEHWLKHFDPQKDDFSTAYDKALSSEVSARLWKGNYNSPKSRMIELINAHPDIMRIAFMDLFNDSGDLSLRMGRFIHYCDEALEVAREKNKKLNSHGQDKYMMSLYLSLNFPEQYGLYQYRKFARAMDMLEVTDIPLQDDVERYYKILRNLSLFCHKEEEHKLFYERVAASENQKMVIIANELIHYMVTHHRS